MSKSLTDFVEAMFAGPVWPASVLVCLLILYTALALLGLVDFEWGWGSGIDVDMEPGVGGSGATSHSFGDGAPLGGIGAATLRWSNLGHVPLIVWLSVFAIAFWAISYGLWHGFDNQHHAPVSAMSLVLVVRNSVIAVAVTKMFTTPLKKVFRRPPQFGPMTLIGRQCVVTSGEVSHQYGQAKFRTDAAPLLLNIRTDGERFPKGTRVEIVAFDAEQRIYKVSAVTSGTDS